MSKTSNFQRVVQKALLTIANKVDPDNSNGAGKADYFDVVSTSLERIADHYEGGGSGGGGVGIVNEVYDEETDKTSLDKSFREIAAMHETAPCFVRTTETSSPYYPILSVRQRSENAFAVTTYQEYSQEFYYITDSVDGYPVLSSDGDGSGGESEPIT